MSRTWHLRIRKIHRYLGLFVGIQFMCWTLGGLYFSWSTLDTIHGDHLKRPAEAIPMNLSLVSPSISMQALRQRVGADSIQAILLIDVLGQPVYQLTYSLFHGNGHTVTHTQLADARTGALRPPLSEQEATAMAQRRFAGPSAIERVAYLTQTGGHHEYRKKPLPAYAVTFRQPAHATVYVAAQLGTVQSVRTDPWRVFDWLWMLHTMDFDGRDDFNNTLLRFVSILGLLTILSGFTVYVSSLPRFRPVRKAER